MSGVLGSRWRRWVAFVAQRETAEGLALFRMITGCALLAAVGGPAAAGLVEPFWVDLAYGGMRPLEPGWLLEMLGGATPRGTWTLVVVALVAGLALVVGVGGRVAAAVGGQTLIALSSLNAHTRGSYDNLLINSLWLLVLADSTATLSIACRRKTGRWISDRLVAAWPRYLAVVQLGALYWFTGLHKVSIYWTPAGGFSALYYILQQPSWHYAPMPWLAYVYPLTQVATASAWLFELTWPLVFVALYFRMHPERPGRVRRLFNRLRVRSVYVGIGVTMHLGIALVMDVGPFTLATLALYPCLFRPAELRAAARRVAGLLPWSGWGA